MKAIWRANPNGPKYWPSDKALQAEKDLGITRVYYPILRRDDNTGYYIFNNLQMTQQYAKDISGHFEFGLYYHPEAWDGDRNAQSIVNKMDQAYQVCSPYVKGVMWDIEDHFVNDRVIAIISAWRAKHPTGPIAWTMEPFQAGWMNKALVKKVNSDTNMVVVVQDFYGDMSPAGTRGNKTPAQELLSIGFAQNRIKTFYNAARVNEWKSYWDGCILSEETLPTY